MFPLQQLLLLLLLLSVIGERITETIFLIS
jgi:hypothetical protein